MSQINGDSRTLRSGVKGNFHAPFWRPVREGNFPTEFNYYPPDSLLAHEYGEGWRYIVMPDRYFEDEENYPEDKLQALTPQELKTQIQTEIEQLSHQIQLLTSELENIARKHFCDVKISHLIRKFKHE
ncbi:hypothetical protein IQ243_24665 [Nostocales cyanobacterium LEGE 11386]|nr:hypothetical protein [Nostocales cyanobacterium LEGE 11386]